MVFCLKWNFWCPTFKIKNSAFFSLKLQRFLKNILGVLSNVQHLLRNRSRKSDYSWLYIRRRFVSDRLFRRHWNWIALRIHCLFHHKVIFLLDNSWQSEISDTLEMSTFSIQSLSSWFPIARIWSVKCSDFRVSWRKSFFMDFKMILWDDAWSSELYSVAQLWNST